MIMKTCFIYLIRTLNDILDDVHKRKQIVNLHSKCIMNYSFGASLGSDFAFEYPLR